MTKPVRIQEETMDEIERVARAIYESREFHGDDPNKRPWTINGNSLMQDSARTLASAALEAMDGWVPINEIPDEILKNGTRVLLSKCGWTTDTSGLPEGSPKFAKRMFEKGAPRVFSLWWASSGYYHKGRWTDGIDNLVPPTHWMPLPSLPAEDKEQ
jgi:hypothetical protein